MLRLSVLTPSVKAACYNLGWAVLRSGRRGGGRLLGLRARWAKAREASMIDAAIIVLSIASVVAALLPAFLARPRHSEPERSQNREQSGGRAMAKYRKAS
jgi:hypothetical protein